MATLLVMGHRYRVLMNLYDSDLTIYASESWEAGVLGYSVA
jgi:hypothetical protein